MKSMIRRLAMLAMLLAAGSVQAQMTAHQTVEDIMQRLFGDLEENRVAYRENPELFYRAIDVYIGESVDIEGIARSVMTVRYSRRASAEQIKRFEINFKDSLLRFYGNALLEFNNQDAKILPPLGPEGDERAEVRMEVRDANGTIYPVSYTMVWKNERWQLRNVIVEGINIGKLFRDLFAEAMQTNRNNLDLVIDNWADTVARNQQAEKQQ